MKRTSLCILIVLIAGSAFCQQFSVGVRAGLGSYSMDLLDDFQKYRTQQAQLPLKITESYPITPFYRAEAALNDLKYVDKIALFYGFYSTGARSTLSDYSGRADLDAILNANQFGFTIQKTFRRNGPWSYAAYGDFLFMVSKLKTKDMIEIVYPQKIAEQQEYSFVANGYAIEPGMMVSYKMNPLVFQINLGLAADFSKNFHLEGEKDMVLGINNKSVAPQWLGVRLGVQVTYLLRKKKE